MASFKLGIRFKLLVLSLFLFTIPWLGYQYVWELESYLRSGQEQTMVGTARAIATALHERPSLFDHSAAYLKTVRPGTDLYAHPIDYPIQLDGKLADWQEYRSLMLGYGEQQLIQQAQTYEPHSLQFQHMVGRYRDYLYAVFEVEDDQLVFRPSNSLRVDRNDHLRIALTAPDGTFQRYVVAPMGSGWVNAYLLEASEEVLRPVQPENRIQGQWLATPQGYNLELRFPLSMLAGNIAFALVDVDDAEQRDMKYAVGTANPEHSDSLGTVLVPSPQIEAILRSLKYANSRVWVVDKHLRVLAKVGDIRKATGIRAPAENKDRDSLWYKIEQQWLLPLYYRVLTRPPQEFVDELQDAYALEGMDIQGALQGKPDSLWRLTPDNKAVILSAAHPIFINDEVRGAVVVEQTTHGIRTVRNRALERLFHVILGVMTLGTLALFLFASRISSRIRKLRDNAESAIDANGKIVGQIPTSNSQDEIGDLSRTFSGILNKLSQYNAYLENMASRLSHELRTPVAVVNSSLENLAMENNDQSQDQYIQRAQSGIHRLSRILTSMSEASRLEQAFVDTVREPFVLNDLLRGCVESYQSAYPLRQFKLQESSNALCISGSPELFAQMLDKIVTNAMEFSEQGTTIHMHLWKEAGQASITIVNKGQLLPKDMQSQLMDSMVSVRTDSSPHDAHLGLGLYVAKLIVDYHQGNITIADLPDNTGVCVKLIFNLHA